MAELVNVETDQLALRCTRVTGCRRVQKRERAWERRTEVTFEAEGYVPLEVTSGGHLAPGSDRRCWPTGLECWPWAPQLPARVSEHLEVTWALRSFGARHGHPARSRRRKSSPEAWRSAPPPSKLNVVLHYDTARARVSPLARAMTLPSSSSSPSSAAPAVIACVTDPTCVGDPLPL